MAKITRKDQKIFGESAGATGITEYGSPAAGAPVYSTDPDDIQTADWLAGWAAAALAGSEIPTFQDFNGIHHVQTRQLAYILQEGLAEYSAGTEYHQNSIVKKTGSYELYGSKVNSNTGNALPSQVDDANWEYLGVIGNAGAAFASNTESNTGTAIDRALTPANFGTQQSLAASGYQYLPAGLILQWGVINSGAAATYVFPVAFPNAVLSLCGGSDEGVDLDEAIGFSDTTLTNFISRSFTDTGGNGAGGKYFAIGY